MLELRPNCELCDKDLPPNSADARICTYECTFCSACVHDILQNVCPNCGGGFEKRPIRPSTARREGVSLNHQAASATRVHTKFSETEIKEFAKGVKVIPPEDR